MTERNTPSISSHELDWDEAEVREGRQPGAVVSVRLGPAEAARLRALADSSGLNVSQVIRRALAEFGSKREQRREQKVFVAAFTYGGTMPVMHEQGWRWSGPAQMQLPSGETQSRVDAPTTTEPTRVVERVTVTA